MDPSLINYFILLIIIVPIILGIFTTYFDVLQKKIFSVLKTNLLIRNVIIFILIYIVLILIGWYHDFSFMNFNFNVLNPETNNDILDDMETKLTFKQELKLILEYLVYTAVFCLVLIIILRIDTVYIITFIILCSISFLLYILKTNIKIGDQYFKSRNLNFITPKETREIMDKLVKKYSHTNKKQLINFKINIRKNIILTNTETALLYISVLVLLVGFIMAYIKRNKKYNKLDFFIKPELNYKYKGSKSI